MNINTNISVSIVYASYIEIDIRISVSIVYIYIYIYIYIYYMYISGQSFHCLIDRQLFPPRLPVLLRAQSRILRHPHVRAVVSDRRAIVDLVLAPPGRLPSPGCPRHHHGPHHDHPHLQLQRLPSKDLLSEEHRYLPGSLLRHGLLVTARVRMRQLYREPEVATEATQDGRLRKRKSGRKWPTAAYRQNSDQKSEQL